MNRPRRRISGGASRSRHLAVQGGRRPWTCVKSLLLCRGGEIPGATWPPVIRHVEKVLRGWGLIWAYLQVDIKRREVKAGPHGLPLVERGFAHQPRHRFTPNPGPHND